MFPWLNMVSEMTSLTKFETVLNSCKRIGTGNCIVLITSISVIPERDS